MHSRYLLEKNLTRRVLLRGVAQASMLGLAGIGLNGCVGILLLANSEITGPGLGAIAGRKGRLYGVALQSSHLDDADFAAAVKSEATLLVPESELKWEALRPAPGTFDFSGYRRLAAFAQENGMQMRGHTLVWYYANPPWLEHALKDRRAAEKILATHIERVIGETSPFIRQWDVVNEAVHPSSTRGDVLRPSIWLDALGPSYIPLAYRLAHEANPDLELVYNEYGLEWDGIYGRRKRDGVLRLLEKMVAEGVPVHALGLQSHLRCHRPLDTDAFTAFLERVREMGLKVYVTEFDLDLSVLSGTAADKIRIAQNYAAAYLDAVQLSGDVRMLLTWGLSDRYSWLGSVRGDSTGALPLDADLRRGPLWETLRDRWAEV